MIKTLSYTVTGQRIEVTETAMLVAGTVNIYTANFSFDAAWGGLQRTAVFAVDGITREQLLEDDVCTVPWEVLAAGNRLRVGVYGTKADGTRLPTIWTERRLYINPGAGPTQEAADPSPTLVEQLLAKMGDLAALKTEDKSSLVAAINEVWSSGGSGGASVTDAAINEDGHLIITLSSGKEIDAGYAVGPAGSDGQDGANGKSAYQYAKDGGYTGTEAEFAAKLAAEIPAIDDTLTASGKAADAAAVGARLSSLSEEISDCIKAPTTAEVGQTIVVKAIGDDGKPTEWEPVTLPEQVQADWNQNDETRNDYVKNRTHYEESTYVDYVLNMRPTEITGFSIAEVGETTTVKINGVESAETVKEAESSTIGSSYKYIGNIDFDSLLTGGTGWFVGEIQGRVIGLANPDTTIAVEIIVVHKINNKFINFDGFVRTFDYYFKDSTIYKTLYKDDGSECLLYTCNNFILPEKNSQLFGFMGEIGFSKVGSVEAQSCFVTGFIINDDGSIKIGQAIFGTNTAEMEQLAADYGYTLTTKPNA